MVDAERLNTEAVKGDGLLVLRKLHALNGKRKLRRDDAQGIHHPGKAFGPNEQKRFGAFRVPHGEKHAGKAADMVGMIMGETYNIHRLRTPALLLHRNLRSLAAVNHDTFSIITGHEGCEPPIRQRHHSSGSQ